MSIFDNTTEAKSGRTLPFEIRAEVYRLVFAEGRTKSQVLVDLETKAVAAGATWTSGNSITTKATYDGIMSVLDGLYRHLPGSREALAQLARDRQTQQAQQGTPRPAKAK